MTKIGYKQTEEHKRKISEKAKNRIFSQDTKEKMSKSQIGRHHTEESKEKLRKVHLGKKASDETKRKMSEKRKGRTLSEEWKMRISKSKSKYKFSEEHKENLSKSHKRENLSNESIRNISNAAKGNKSHLGMLHSDETKKKISESLIGRFSGKNNPSYGKPRYHTKRYFYNSPLQGEIYLRSSYELAYAKYLDSINELWYYEIETFELSDEMTYTPDFFLPKTDKFIEIKGWMTYKCQNKINKFLEQYPWDLEILYKQDLIRLGIEL